MICFLKALQPLAYVTYFVPKRKQTSIKNPKKKIFNNNNGVIIIVHRNVDSDSLLMHQFIYIIKPVIYEKKRGQNEAYCYKKNLTFLFAKGGRHIYKLACCDNA